MSDPYRYADPEELFWDEVAEAEEAQCRAFAEEAIDEMTVRAGIPIAEEVRSAAVEEMLEAGVDVRVEGLDESEFVVTPRFQLAASIALERSVTSYLTWRRTARAIRSSPRPHSCRHRGGPSRRPRHTRQRRARAPARSDDPDPHLGCPTRSDLLTLGGRA